MMSYYLRFCSVISWFCSANVRWPTVIITPEYVRVNDNTICAQMETPTHTSVRTCTQIHTYKCATNNKKSYFIQIFKKYLSRTEECNVKRQSLPKEGDGGSYVPEAVDVGKKVREALDHQAMEEIER